MRTGILQRLSVAWFYERRSLHGAPSLTLQGLWYALQPAMRTLGALDDMLFFALRGAYGHNGGAAQCEEVGLKGGGQLETT